MKKFAFKLKASTTHSTRGEKKKSNGKYDISKFFHIYKKKGKGVNGVYNQDFSSNCILIEFGGNKNTIDEVYNTVIALGEIISNYIGDTFEK